MSIEWKVENQLWLNFWKRCSIIKVKQITVSGAIILRENNGIKEIFATQRGYGDWKGWWEIPGGKLESGETPEQCIVREIREELATEVRAEKILGVVDYDYPTFHLTMHCILCSIVSGDLKLLELLHLHNRL